MLMVKGFLMKEGESGGWWLYIALAEEVRKRKRRKM